MDSTNCLFAALSGLYAEKRRHEVRRGRCWEISAELEGEMESI